MATTTLIDAALADLRAKRDEIDSAIETFGSIDWSFMSSGVPASLVIDTTQSPIPVNQLPKGKAKPGRKAGTGRRQREAFDVIAKSKKPLTITQIADRMKLNSPNYLYRILPDLENKHEINRSEDGRYTAV